MELHAPSPDNERTLLFGILTVLTATTTLALVTLRGHLVVSPYLFAAIAVPWLAFSIYLRLHRKTIGRERRYIDFWSIPHLGGGALLGLLGLPLIYVALLAVWWEVAESISRVFEHFTNRLADIVLALLGCAAAHYFATGTLQWRP